MMRYFDCAIKIKWSKQSAELNTKLIVLVPFCRTLANQRQTSAAKKALELFRTHVSDLAALAGGKAHPSMGM